MSHPIPENVQRLARRLRLAADEMESAARYGVPVPDLLFVDGWEYGQGVNFSASPEEFTAWRDYTADAGPVVTRTDQYAELSVNVNGLPVHLTCRTDLLPAEATA